MKYQAGSIRKRRRKSGSEVWEFRYRDASGVMRQQTYPVSEYSTLAAVKVAIQPLVFRMNTKAAMSESTPFGLVVERFISEERLREIVGQEPGQVTERNGVSYATAKTYLSIFKTRILPRWGDVPIAQIKPLEVLQWLKGLECASITRGNTKALMHVIFERAMLWELLPIARNPIDLVEIKGSGKRKKKKVVLSVEQFHAIRAGLSEPYRSMATMAICTGLRISEICALRWEHIVDGALRVQASSYDGRIGTVKTEASGGEIPLHPDILAGLTPLASGLIFPTSAGKAQWGSNIQRKVLRPLGATMGIENLGWHTFRHTYRSLLDGEPVGVQQKLMRHANVSTTMNVYGDSAMDAKRQAQSKVVHMVVGRLA